MTTTAATTTTTANSQPTTNKNNNNNNNDNNNNRNDSNSSSDNNSTATKQPTMHTKSRDSVRQRPSQAKRAAAIARGSKKQAHAHTGEEETTMNLPRATQDHM